MGDEKTSATTGKAETKVKPVDQGKTTDAKEGRATAPTFDQDAAVIAILANPQFVDEVRASADKRAEKARVKEAEKVEKERGERRQASREARETLLSGDSADPDAGDFDIADYDIGKLLLDDGDHFSIDFSHRVTSAQLERVDGNGLLLKSKPITIGEGVDEAFQVCAVVLTLQADDAPNRIFRCKLPNAVTIGGGAKAQLGENSLLFRPV